ELPAVRSRAGGRLRASVDQEVNGSLLYCYSYGYYSGMKQVRVDAYVLETLMADLVLHDRRPSAFLVYLHLWGRSAGRKGAVRASHQQIVDGTGLSKSSVQGAVRTLTARR